VSIRARRLDYLTLSGLRGQDQGKAKDKARPRTSTAAASRSRYVVRSDLQHLLSLFWGDAQPKHRRQTRTSTVQLQSRFACTVRPLTDGRPCTCMSYPLIAPRAGKPSWRSSKRTDYRADSLRPLVPSCAKSGEPWRKPRGQPDGLSDSMMRSYSRSARRWNRLATPACH
jgi:hypothetical protein